MKLFQHVFYHALPDEPTIDDAAEILPTDQQMEEWLTKLALNPGPRRDWAWRLYDKFNYCPF